MDCTVRPGTTGLLDFGWIDNDPDGLGIDKLGTIDQSDIIAVFVDGALMAGDAQRFRNKPTESCPNEIDGKMASSYAWTSLGTPSALTNEAALTNEGDERPKRRLDRCQQAGAV